MLSESASIPCTNFGFCEGWINNCFENILIYKVSSILSWREKIPGKKSTCFRRWCKWCAIRWYQTSVSLNFVLNMIKLHYVDGFLCIVWWCPQIDIEFKESINKLKSNFKMVKVMNSASKTILNHLLLPIAFDGKYWLSQLHILHSSIQHNNRGHHKERELNFNSNNVLLLLVSLWPKALRFQYTGAFFWSTLPCLAPSTTHDALFHLY